MSTTKQDMKREVWLAQAKQYYPKLWDKSRLEALVAAGRLDEKDVAEIIGKSVQK